MEGILVFHRGLWRGTLEWVSDWEVATMRPPEILAAPKPTSTRQLTYLVATPRTPPMTTTNTDILIVALDNKWRSDGQIHVW
jgi:hypothetical protein